jgi:hypothetical protein
MAFLEKHPIHVRRKIALGITLGVGFVLFLVMIFIYTSNKKEGKKPDSAITAFRRFYTTSKQSYFNSNSDIITK